MTGKALAYLSQQWPTGVAYCEDGCLDIDNSGVEGAIRPFVMGRNRWLFANGANASVLLYSLIETAKLNGLGALPLSLPGI